MISDGITATNIPQTDDPKFHRCNPCCAAISFINTIGLYAHPPLTFLSHPQTLLSPLVSWFSWFCLPRMFVILFRLMFDLVVLGDTVC